MKPWGKETCHRYGRLCGSPALAAILAAFVPGEAAAQVPGPGATAPVEETRASNIRDAAGLFEPDAVAAARKELRELESKTGVATMIATVEALGERSIEDEAPRMARESGIEGHLHPDQQEGQENPGPGVASLSERNDEARSAT